MVWGKDSNYFLFAYECPTVSEPAVVYHWITLATLKFSRLNAKPIYFLALIIMS